MKRDHIKPTYDEEPTNAELYRWALFGILKWTYYASAIGVGVWAAMMLSP
jgi:hypothetical protein